MNNAPSVHSIFICSGAGLVMEAKEKVRVLAGLGVDGDRYALQLGAFSKSKPQKIRDITLISKMGIDESNNWLNSKGLVNFTISETRRNIVIQNFLPEDLNALVGKTFFLGRLKLIGVELCTPCERPSKLANKKHFLNAFEGKGGIRAQVLEGAELVVGDLLTI